MSPLPPEEPSLTSIDGLDDPILGRAASLDRAIPHAPSPVSLPRVLKASIAPADGADGGPPLDDDNVVLPELENGETFDAPLLSQPVLETPDTEPPTHRTYHDRAMRLVERALVERRTASREDRKAWLLEALDQEILAAQITTDPEWRAVLYQSAAAIARKLGRSKEARSMDRKAKRWAVRAREAADQRTWWTRLRADWRRLVGKTPSA